MACGLLGSFLVLKQMSMVSDCITHTILLGIVLAFLVVGDLSSPFLLLGATFMGVFTVWLIEMLSQSKRLSHDSAIGVVFPFLFSLAIILISKYAENTHLDTDSVLLGELAFAPFHRLILWGKDLGAVSLWLSILVLGLNLVFVVAWGKELKLAIFDPIFALTLGISPVLLHYIFLTLLSFTAVCAFQAVGSILVIALMIAPSSGAYLLCHNLKTMLVLATILGGISGFFGALLGIFLGNISFAGAMATTAGFVFFLCFLIREHLKTPRQRLSQN